MFFSSRSAFSMELVWKIHGVDCKRRLAKCIYFLDITNNFYSNVMNTPPVVVAVGLILFPAEYKQCM